MVTGILLIPKKRPKAIEVRVQTDVGGFDGEVAVQVGATQLPATHLTIKSFGATGTGSFTVTHSVSGSVTVLVKAGKFTHRELLNLGQ